MLTQSRDKYILLETMILFKKFDFLSELNNDNCPWYKFNKLDNTHIILNYSGLHIIFKIIEKTLIANNIV